MKRVSLFIAFMCLIFVFEVSAQFTATGFITTWKTDNTGSSADNEITIPTSGGGYNYDVYWEEEGNATNNGTVTSLTGTATITFPSAGTYRVQISGTFPRISFYSGYPNNDRLKLLTVEQWGDNAWTTMYRAFYACNISIPATDAPNLSACTNLGGMFYYSSVNSPMNHWDVSTIEDMSQMFFSNSNFNQPLNNWNVSNVTNMTEMFRGCLNFNQDIGGWNVANVEGMSGMFHGAFAFNQDIDGWTMDNVQYTAYMFYNTSDFNQDLNSWNVSNVLNMSAMFQNARAFNGNISSWTPTSTTNMSLMFADSPFNNDISGWDVSSVENMSAMFYGDTVFNQNIGGWTVSNVQNMSGMFEDASNFNQDISGWDMTGVTSVAGINSMFRNARDFNQDISSWNTTNITNMAYMFDDAISFNQDLSSWVVTNVTNMARMFSGASSFNQDLGAWNIVSVTDMTNMFSGNTNMSVQNYDNTLIGWSGLSLQSGVTLGALGLIYCQSPTERSILTGTFGWNIIGDEECTAFTTTWQTDNNGSSNNDQITIPTTGTGYFYSIYWEEVGNATNNGTLDDQTGSATITFPSTGTYRVEIKGDFPRIFFNDDANDKLKLLTIEQWGNVRWQSMAYAFAGCANMTLNAVGNPYLLHVTSLEGMFMNATSFNGVIGTWDISGVTNTASMFEGATAFNQSINSWVIFGITDMSNMFNGATSFNQDLSGWTNTYNVLSMDGMFENATLFNQPLSGMPVGSVTSMKSMFAGATSFNQSLSGWDVSNVTDMTDMFNGATSFDQNISGWNIGNVADMSGMLNNTALSTANYDNLLSAWETQTVQTGVTLGASGLTYCVAADERQALIDDHNWTINGDSDCALGLEDDLLGASLKLFPNPVSDKLIVEFNDASIFKNRDVEVEVISITGEIFYNHLVDSQKMIVIPVDRLSQGMYFVNIYFNKKHLSRKFIKH